MRCFLFLLALPLLASAYNNAKMLCLVNKQRVAAGLSCLGLDSRLTQSAQEHSDDQARMNSMTHSGSDGSQPGQRITRAGYQWQAVAENVAFGYGDEEKCMQEWMNSPGHRENILGPYTHFGSAVGYSGSTPYYTQDFGANGDGGNFPECPDGSEGGDDDNKGHGGKHDHGGKHGGHGHGNMGGSQSHGHDHGNSHQGGMQSSSGMGTMTMLSDDADSDDDDSMTMTYTDSDSNSNGGWQRGGHRHRHGRGNWQNGGGGMTTWGGGWFQHGHRH